VRILEGGSAHPPVHPGGVPSRTPPGGGSAHPPSLNTEYRKNNQETQSVRPCSLPGAVMTDGLTEDGSRRTFDWDAWLKNGASDSWPPPLLEGLGVRLDPPQVACIEARSPWNGEGAWAILQAIESRGKSLRQPAGTLWNALVRVDKGATWLSRTGPVLRKAGWFSLPEDGTDREDWKRAQGARTLANAGLRRLPLHGEALAEHRALETKPRDPEAWFDNEDEALEEAPSETLQLAQPPLVRPEELGPELKAELRTLIQRQRDAFQSACHAPKAEQEGLLSVSSRCWESIGALLEPALPLLVQLPDLDQPFALRHRSQIKSKVLTALYQSLA
jgi:hypothetical protein